MEHTKGILKIKEPQSLYVDSDNNTSGKQKIAYLSGHLSLEKGEVRANAERFILTWNSHDELVKHNKELLEALHGVLNADELNPVAVFKAQQDALEAINNTKS